MGNRVASPIRYMSVDTRIRSISSDILGRGEEGHQRYEGGRGLGGE